MPNGGTCGGAPDTSGCEFVYLAQAHTPAGLSGGRPRCRSGQAGGPATVGPAAVAPSPV